MRGILRILNTMFWCWIALSNVLAPISTSADFWVERAQLLFQLGPIENALGNTDLLLKESGASNASGEASNIARLRRHLGRHEPEGSVGCF